MPVEKISDYTKLKWLRYAMMGLLIFFIAGGIAIYFLVELGATKFEIDESMVGLASGLGYPFFCVFTYIAYALVPRGEGLIRIVPFSKKEETLQFYVAIGSVVIGVLMMIIFRSNENALQMASFAWLLFYVPGLTFRFAIMLTKSLKNKKQAWIITLVYIVCVLFPVGVAVFGYIKEESGYGILCLTYMLPLLALLTIGYKEDDLNENDEIN